MRARVLFRFFLCFCLVQLVASIIDEDEEFQIVENSRKIIKRIENCKQKAHYTESLADEGEPKAIKSADDVQCGVTSFMDITRVSVDNINNHEIRTDSMIMAYEALKKASNFSAMEDYLGEMLNAKPGSRSRWLVVVTKAQSKFSTFEKDFPEFLDFLIAGIRIRIFNMESSPPSSTPSTNSRPVIQQTTTEADSAAEMPDEMDPIETLLEEASSNLGLDPKKNRIHVASALNLLPVVQDLVDEKNVDPNLRDHEGRTPSMFAAANNSIEVLKYFGDDLKVNLRVKDNQGNTLIHYASTGAIVTLRYLIREKKLNFLNAKNKKGHTPLVKSISSPDSELACVRYLVEVGKADLNVKSINPSWTEIVEYLKFEQWKSEEKSKPFDLMSFFAVSLETGDLTKLKYIIQKKQESLYYINMDPNSEDKYKVTPVMEACKISLKILKLLIEAGGNPNSKNVKNESTLHYAIMGNKPDVLRYLIDVYHVDISASNLLHYSIQTCPECLYYLVSELKINVNDKSKETGCTAAIEAAKFKKLDLLKYLVKHGANLMAKNNFDKTPLQIAIEQADSDAIEYLKNEILRQQQNSASFDLEAFFSYALDTGEIDFLAFILEKNNVNSGYRFQSNGRTFLHASVLRELPHFVEYLLDKGSDPNTKDSEGLTSVHYAATGPLVIFKLLRIKNGDLNMPDENRKQPVHYAAIFGKLEIIKYLIVEAKVAINASDEHGMKAIHFACVNGHLNVVEYLVEEHKVDINSKTEVTLTRDTPIGLAAYFGQLSVVKYLVEHAKADLSVKDANEMTPVELAELKRNQEVVTYLKKPRNKSG